MVILTILSLAWKAVSLPVTIPLAIIDGVDAIEEKIDDVKSARRRAENARVLEASRKRREEVRKRWGLTSTDKR